MRPGPAGNRVIMEPGELTPRTAAPFRHLVAQAFDETEVAVVTGGVEVSAHFAALPWDTFLFTGGTNTGRRILEAAAPTSRRSSWNSAVSVRRSCCPTRTSARRPRRSRRGRLGNAGQICLSVDYALVPEDRLEEFLAAALVAAVDVYPTVQGNRDYSAMIDERAYDRILSLVDEARARVLQPPPHAGEELDRARRQVPLTVVVNPPRPPSRRQRQPWWRGPEGNRPGQRDPPVTGTDEKRAETCPRKGGSRIPGLAGP